MSCLGANDAAIAAAMGQVGSIPGRFEVLRSAGDVTVIVDYAHTPEGLARLLNDVRRLGPRGRVVTVFGAGGDRDRAKRPEMGRVVSSLSDQTIVTSDNPRFEQPDAIIDASDVGRRGECRSCATDGSSRGDYKSHQWREVG